MQDRAVSDRKTLIVRIKDPCNGKLIASVRDPKVKIGPYRDMDKIIDMQAHIENRTNPQFYKEMSPLNFDEKKLSWGAMLELIKSKEQQK